MASQGLIHLKSERTSVLNQLASLALKAPNEERRKATERLEERLTELDEDIAIVESLEGKIGVAEIAKREAAQAAAQSALVQKVDSISTDIVSKLTANDAEQRAKNEREADAFRKYLRHGDNLSSEKRALVTISDATGGALIPTGYGDVLVEARRSFAPLLQYMYVQYDNTLGTKFSYLDDTASGILINTEGNAFNASGNDPVFASATAAELDLFKTLAVKVSNQLLDDSKFDVPQFLKRIILKRFYRGISRLLITGKDQGGTSAPNNVNLLSLVAAGSNLQTTAALANGIGWDDLVNVAESVDSDYFQSGVWIMSQSTKNTLRGSLDGFGRPFYTPSPSNDSASFDTLMGRPVLVDPSMPSIGANNIPVLFGDLYQSIGVQIAEEIPSILVSVETHAETLETLFQTVSRVASVNLLSAKALTGVKIAAS